MRKREKERIADRCEQASGLQAENREKKKKKHFLMSLLRGKEVKRGETDKMKRLASCLMPFSVVTGRPDVRLAAAFTHTHTLTRTSKRLTKYMHTHI